MTQTSFRNRMKGKVDVWWRKTEPITSHVTIPSSSFIGGYLGLPFRNRMKGNFNIIAPTRVTGILNPVHDTFVSESSPYSIYGSSNNMLVGYNNGKEYQGLLKFNLQKLFPMYNTDSYILIDGILKLTISNTRDIKDGDLDFYEVSLGDWEENSTTWANMPIKSNILSSSYRVEGDENNTGNVNIYIDMNDLVSKWLENPRKNNGIFIEARETINNIISFYSKENGDISLNPQLLITYIDLNSPFLNKKSYLDSTLNVWENKTDTITSELEVEVRRSTNTIPSNLIVLNKPGDLFASLDITKDKLPCEVNIVGNHIQSELTVYTNVTSRINSSINVAQINIANEVKISHLYSFEADLTVGKGKYINGFLGINADRIVNELKLSSMSIVGGASNVFAVDYITNDLRSGHLMPIDGQIVVDSGRNIISDLEVITNAHLSGDIRVSHLYNIESGLIVRGAKNLYSDIFYGRFADVPAELDITPYKNVMSELGVKYGADIFNELGILSVNYLSNYLHATGSSKLLNSIEISNLNCIDGRLNILAEYIKGEVVLFDVAKLESAISVQSCTLDNNLRLSSYSKILSDIAIPDSSYTQSYISILNEHIKALVNVYVNKKDYLDSEIYSLALATTNGELNFNYGSIVHSEMTVYVDKISVLNAYLEIYNEDWEYEQRRGYGYIM